MDTGLACRLQGWTSADTILTSPQQGPLFENLVFAELWKTNLNYQLGWRFYHWRSRAGEEIDFIVERGTNDFMFIEAKVSPQRLPTVEHFPELRKVFGTPSLAHNLNSILLCHQEGEQSLAHQVPLAQLKSRLL